MRYLRSAALLLAASLLTAGAAEPTGEIVAIDAPPFTVRAPAALSFHAERIAALAPGLASRVAADLHLPPPAAGTIVVLAASTPEGPLRETARAMPSWAAGQAFPRSGTILLRLDRIGSYGQRDLGAVLAHELAHLTVGGALPAGGNELPRWLREGIAAAAAGEGEWRDHWHVWTSTLASSPRPFSELEAAFARGGASRSMAYAGSLAAVRFLRKTFGREFPSRLIGAIREGREFPSAFRSATGVTLEVAAAYWKKELGRPRRWVMWIGSALTLWTGATLLILLAYTVKRRRGRRTLERWREEEEPPAPTGTGGSGTGPAETIH